MYINHAFTTGWALSRPAHTSDADYLGLINYIDNKANVIILKNLPVKGLCVRCLSEFIDWRHSKSCVLFSTQLCKLLPLSPSVWFSSPPFPPFPVWISILHTRIRGGIWGSRLQTDKHLPQSPFTGKFVRWRHFALPSMSLIFLCWLCFISSAAWGNQYNSSHGAFNVYYGTVIHSRKAFEDILLYIIILYKNYIFL
jgi:hypothetical protein